MKGALAIFRWKMLPPLKLRDPFCVFAKRKPQNWWPEVESFPDPGTNHLDNFGKSTAYVNLAHCQGH